jgi:hypothetical protein
VKIYFDEDNGSGIPRALKLVRMPAAQIEYPRDSPNALQKLGTPDRIWIPWAGDTRYLVFSQNIHILENEEEFRLLVQHNVGIVFMNNGSELAWAVLRMIMVRWEWLQSVDNHESRPFVYIVGLTGRPVAYDLRQGPRRARTRQRSSVPSPSGERH